MASSKKDDSANGGGAEVLGSLRAKLEQDPDDRESLEAFQSLARKQHRDSELEELYVWLGEHARHETAGYIYELLFELYSIEDELEPRWEVVVAHLARRVERARAEKHEQADDLLRWLEEAFQNLGPGHPTPAVLKKINAERVAEKAEKAKKDKESAGAAASVAMLIIGGVLLLFGVGAFAIGLLGARTAARMDRWHKTSGKITRVWIEKHLWKSTNWHYPKIAYTYTVKGKQYTASRLALGSTLSFQTRKEAEDALKPFREQPNVTVYYDPEKPSSAVLNRKSGKKDNRDNIYGGVGLGLLGLVLLVIGIVKRRRRPREGGGER